METRNLQLQFQRKVRPRLTAKGDIENLSIFALAPQPLLIELGRLLSDIPQLKYINFIENHLIGDGRRRQMDFAFHIEEPAETHATVALNLSLSATIENQEFRTSFTRRIFLSGE